ncbi:MAG: hypothetical protein JWO94_509, partial [Verrucomicrobiaceae bacterium]|nr:hypothetical protein [Verrucomicrobiaceae bacterium]
MNRTRFLLSALFSLLFAVAAQAQLEIKGGVTNLLTYQRAGASARVTGGAVSQITVRGGGGGYLSAPQVIVGPPTGAGGTTATATATVAGGVVTAIQVISGGTGYSLPPVVNIAAPVTPTGIPATTPQFAGVGITSASAGAISTNGLTAGRYPSAIDHSVPAVPVVKVVLVRASFGHSFASGVPRYFMGDEIPRPTTRWDGALTSSSYWRAKPVQPGENFAGAYVGNLGGSTQPLVPLGTVNVTSASTGSTTVTVASVPPGLISGANLLGQRVNIVSGTTVTLAGKAVQNIGTSTPVSFAPYQPFYFSPHAGTVFATQPGRVTITWVSNAPDTSKPGETTATYKFRTDVFSVSSASKSPARSIYWTEKSFAGPVVTIPSGRIVTVNTVYNTFMPSHVVNEFVPIGYTPNTDPSATPAAEVRTLWYDTTVGQGSLHSYNLEGRVFIEYLGAAVQGSGEEVHEFLGADIVEVKRVAEATIVETKLGEQLRPRQEAAQDGDDKLLPSIVFNPEQSNKPLYGTAALDNGKLVYSAERENTNPDKIQIYWLEEDDAAISLLTPPAVPGLVVHWPKYLRKYTQVWPSSISEFEPVAVTSNGNDAATGPKFDAAHLPQVIFQDDPAESEVSVDATTQRLLVNFTASADQTSRTLLKFGSASTPWYVRLFIQSQDALGTPAGADPDGSGPLSGAAPVASINDRNADGLADISATVNVGDRINPPSSAYSVAGYISTGTCYYPAGYIDPFANGVPAAEAGAIIPVNAISGRNQLTVWWFKKVVAPSANFSSFYVPAIAGHYTVVYPTSPAPPEIVIASNLGTGDLVGAKARGSIYYQNDSSKVGYNPNEEHALIVAGRAYALRDDLNTASTSQPFVLLAYTNGDDSRPSVDVSQVVRSNATYQLTYNSVAGTRQ